MALSLEDESVLAESVRECCDYLLVIEGWTYSENERLVVTVVEHCWQGQPHSSKATSSEGHSRGCSSWKPSETCTYTYPSKQAS